MDIDIEKKQLAQSDIWQRIKKIELDKIMNSSDGATEPLIIKGMLRTLKDIDSWK